MSSAALRHIPSAPTGDCWKSIGVQGDHSCVELKRHIHCRNCPAFTAGARRLLDRAPSNDDRTRWTNVLSEPKESLRKEDLSLFVFRLGSEWLALPTKVFVEVTDMRAPRPLPHRTNDSFLGLVNIRGELQLCLSLHKLLEVERDPKLKDAPRMAVVEKDKTRWAFAVDAVHGLFRVAEGDLKPAPVTVSKALQPHVRGVLDWDGKNLGCLDEELLFYQLARSIE